MYQNEEFATRTIICQWSQKINFFQRKNKIIVLNPLADICSCFKHKCTSFEH